MTHPYNALYGPPQAPVDNALYYDDTQGMPRSRPADPLRWLADAVGQNKDLPAPQFFMDPRALSARNMLHSALNTSANWLDGTRDPSRIGPEEMIAPLGLAGMGTGIANALTRAAPDHRMAEALAREHPGAIGGGTLQRGFIAGHPRVWVSGDDGMTSATRGTLKPASNPTRAAYVADFSSLPSAPTRPTNYNGPYAVMAENAKGSAPGTVVNSGQQQEDGGVGGFLHRNFVDATVPLSSDENEWAQEIMGSRQLAREDRLRAAEQWGKSAAEYNSKWVDYLPQEMAGKALRNFFEKYGTGGPIEPINTPANSTQQQTQDDGVISILKRYGLAD